MKNTFKIFGIIAVVAVIGLTITGCSSLLSSLSVTENNATEKAPSSNPFLGKWLGTDYEGEKMLFVFDATKVTLSYPDTGGSNSTTYTYNGNVATFKGPNFTAKCTISENTMTVLAGETFFAKLSKQ